jgi:hypothetical protein
MLNVAINAEFGSSGNGVGDGAKYVVLVVV